MRAFKRRIRIATGNEHCPRNSNANGIPAFLRLLTPKLLESGKRKGAREVLRTIGLYDSFRRRLVSLAFATVLILEAIRSVIGTAINPWDQMDPASNTFYSAVNGAIKIFCASLILADSTSIQLRGLSFQIGFLLQMIHLFLDVSASILYLSTSFSGWGDTGVVSVAFTLLYLEGCLEDLIWWEPRKLQLLREVVEALRIPNDATASEHSLNWSD
jgi:hypothetical protein